MKMATQRDQASRLTLQSPYTHQLSMLRVRVFTQRKGRKAGVEVEGQRRADAGMRVL